MYSTVLYVTFCDELNDDSIKVTEKIHTRPITRMRKWFKKQGE